MLDVNGKMTEFERLCSRVSQRMGDLYVVNPDDDLDAPCALCKFTLRTHRVDDELSRDHAFVEPL